MLGRYMVVEVQRRALWIYLISDFDVTYCGWCLMIDEL